MSALDDLRAVAATRNYSTAQIAQKTGLSAKTVTMILNGSQKDPMLSSLEALAKAFGCSIECRTGGEEYVEATADVAYYRRLLEEKQDQIAAKDKWIYRLFIVCLVLIAAIVIISLVFAEVEL